MAKILNANTLLLSFSLTLASVCSIRAQVLDVTMYGNYIDITSGLQKAWEEACASPTPITILIPRGVFNLRVIKLEGPCKSPMTIKLIGIVKAPADPVEMNSDGWITVNTVDGLALYGGGTFDGQGKIAWDKNNCHLNQNCAVLPVTLRFNFINNSVIQGITSLDSKNFHVNLFACNNMTFKRFNIIAPDQSPNTDGIHLGESTEINIMKSNIQTGDDCISMGPGSRNIRIKDVTCGPGHGISVGSLGGRPGEPPIIGVIVKNCTFTRTMNGVRVKVWPKANTGTVTDLHFEDLVMSDVQFPVIIDQAYCPHNMCSSEQSLVKISKVTIKNIRGTASTREAIKIMCSGSVPCEGVEITDIDLTYIGADGPATSICSNVNPIVTGFQNPANLRFNFINNSVIQSVTSLDSKNFHVNLFACNNMTIKRFNIIAPDESPNTDGIHLGESTEIKIMKSNIQTGDDCISMGPGSRNIRIKEVTCGPGHGISVGSLGGRPGESPIIGVIVKNCTFTRTMNGVRVKIWPKANAGTITDLHFEDLVMNDVQFPVIIDQAYCPHNMCSSEQSLVKISKVSIKNIRGTTSTPEAVKIMCSGSVPCEGMEISDIDLTYLGVDGPATSICSNVNPIVTGLQNPAICGTNHIP